jgi:hypothetical protein
MTALLLATSLQAAVVGFVDIANCSTVEGWAADTAKLNQSIIVTLGSRTVTANLPRPDVGRVIGDNGLHGFRIAGPYYNGTYTVQVTGGTLSGGTFTLSNCGNPPVVQPPPVTTSDAWTLKLGDKVDIGFGLMLTAVNGRIVIGLDGTTVPLYEDPLKPQCRESAFGRRGKDLYFCADGTWWRVMLVKP